MLAVLPPQSAPTRAPMLMMELNREPGQLSHSTARFQEKPRPSKAVEFLLEHFPPSSLGCSSAVHMGASGKTVSPNQALQMRRILGTLSWPPSMNLGLSTQRARAYLFGFPRRAEQVHKLPSSFYVIPFHGFLVWVYTETYTFISIDFVSFHVVMSFGIPPFIHSPDHRFI